MEKSSEFNLNSLLSDGAKRFRWKSLVISLNYVRPEFSRASHFRLLFYIKMQL